MRENPVVSSYRKDISRYIPEDVIALQSSNPFLKNLVITMLGYYGQAHNHQIYRTGIPEHILLYCMDGKGWVDVNGSKIEVCKGEVVFCPANCPHGYGADKVHPWSIYWAHFIGEGVPGLFKMLEISSMTPVMAIGDHPEVVTLFSKALESLSNGYGFPDLFHASTCLQEVFCLLIKHRMHIRARGSDNAGIEKVIAQMREGIHQDFSLKQFADHMNLSKYHFVRLFKQKAGYSPMEYFNRLKIQGACELLDTTSLSIKEISSRLAFSNPFYFSEVFKRFTGYSPKEYRKLQRELHI